MGKNDFILIHISSQFSFEIHVFFHLCEVVIPQNLLSHLFPPLCLIFAN